MARMFRRMLPNVAVSTGQVVTIPIPRNHLFKNLFLRFRGSITITGAAPGTLWSEQPASLLKRVRVIRNGTEVLQSLDGASLAKLAQIDFGTAAPVTALASAAAQASTPVSFDVPINFASLGLSQEGLSLLRAVGTSSLDLELTMGDPSNDLVSQGTNVESLDGGAFFELMTSEIMDVSGRFADRQITFIDRDILTTQTDMSIDLPIGPIYRRIIVKATTGPAAGVPGVTLSNTAVRAVTVKSDGTFPHFDRIGWQNLQNLNKMQYNLETAMSGYAVIDFAEDGSESGMINTANASQFQLVLDVLASNGSGVRVITETIVPGSLPVE